MSGRYERKKPKKKVSATKVLLIVLAVVIALMAVVAGGAWFYLRSKLNKVNYVQMPPKTEPVVVTEATTEPIQTETEQTVAATTEETTVETTVPPMKPEDIINVLVVGQSSRDGEESRLADTMILVSLNTYTKTVTLTSILRDTFAKIPAYAGYGDGRNKITNCYALGYSYTGQTAGAMEMMNLCIQQNFGVEVDYNVEVDFEHFINIIDYLGGVRIELSKEEAEYLNGETLYVKEPVHEGENRLDGMAALAFARMRKAEGDNDSDIKRTERQRRLLTALVNKLKGHPSMMNDMIDSVLPFITTNMDPDTMAGLIVKILPMVIDLKIESGTCPKEGTYWGEMLDIYGDGIEHSILRFDEGANRKYMRAIAEGETE